MSKRNDLNSRDRSRRDVKLSNGLIIGIGSVLVVVTMVLCILGTSTAINSMNRKMDATLAEARQAVADAKVQRELEEESRKAAEFVDNGWTSEQIEWMRENHITFDGEHFVDEDGNIVNDPTQRSAKKPVVSDNKVNDKPEEAQKWWEGNELIQEDENGEPYYEVQGGDSLNKIGNMTGFTSGELADYNKIPAPYMLHRGDVIKFPARDGSGGIDLNKGLG